MEFKRKDTGEPLTPPVSPAAKERLDTPLYVGSLRAAVGVGAIPEVDPERTGFLFKKMQAVPERNGGGSPVDPEGAKRIEADRFAAYVIADALMHETTNRAATAARFIEGVGEVVTAAFVEQPVDQ